MAHRRVRDRAFGYKDTIRMSSRLPSSRSTGLRPAAASRMAATAMLLGVLLSGCLFTETYRRGYILPDGALQQVPLGATQEQVLIVLGTPSTVAKPSEARAEKVTAIAGRRAPWRSKAGTRR
jgi:hypothetical protein